jgi:hypothetical protein
VLQFLEQCVSFFDDCFILVSSVLIVVPVFPHLQESLPHGCDDGRHPYMWVQLLLLLFVIMVALDLFPFGGNLPLVKVDPSGVVLLFESLLDDPDG